MPNEYRVGPVYRAGLIVSGGMCAGLGLAILVALKCHREAYTTLVPNSVPTPPTSAIGFMACGIALIAVAVWVPRVTSVLAMVTLSMVAASVAERAFGLGPRVENLIGANLGTDNWLVIAPNTLVVLLLGAGALLMRHAPHWFAARLGTIAVLGSIIFAIGIVGCVGYMTAVPSYSWQSGVPMSFLSAVCSGVLGLGIVMSACRYSELDSFGVPHWFNQVICTGAMAIIVSTAISYFSRSGHAWKEAEILGLLPMLIVSGVLAVVAARQGWRRQLSEKTQRS
jgi:hypothetical protein